jgi:hypothetical protein
MVRVEGAATKCFSSTLCLCWDDDPHFSIFIIWMIEDIEAVS